MTVLAPPLLASGMRRLLASEVASNFGSMLSRLAIPWLAALMLGATPLHMAWLAIADVSAGAVGTLVVGGLVDRMSRRTVMVAADLVRAVAMVAVILLFATGQLAFWMLVVQSAINGVAAMAFSVARSAWIADNVPDDALTTRNSQMSAASSTSEAAAFGGGGWLYQLSGPLAALITDACSYIASALCLWRLPEVAAQPVRGNSNRGNLYREAVHGFVMVRASPILRALIVSDVLMTLSFSISSAAYMIFVTRELAMATGMQGLIFATGALGSLAGAAMAPALGRMVGAGYALPCGLLAAGVGAICVPLAPSAGLAGILLLVAHQIVGDMGSVIAMIHGRTLRQIHAPKGARGRVDASMRTVSQVVTLIGALGGGWFATVTGTREAMWVSAGCLLVAAPLLFVLLQPVPFEE